jgi:hypothetical protein
MLHQVSLESGGVDSGEVALRATQLWPVAVLQLDVVLQESGLGRFVGAKLAGEGAVKVLRQLNVNSGRFCAKRNTIFRKRNRTTVSEESESDIEATEKLC